jgi:hypothetical protein
MAKKSTGDVYEVHEQTRGQFVWHIWDNEGNLINWWSKDAHIEDVAAEPGMDPQPTMVGQVIFTTEDAAMEYCESELGATMKTKFTE